ncbi:MAG: DnaJ domain-containing protein [Rhizobiales bacterium]|nr:DnaJ domain-containing protein [Hyphomicrobiales bacterium]
MSSSALYQTLNVNKNVDDKELKSAYRKLAKKFHPDSNKDDPKAAEQFSKISNAYDILKDKEKRQQYDAGIIDDKGNQTGFGAGNPFGGRQPRGGAHPFGNAGFNGGGQGGFDDIFSGLFGGGGMGGQPRPQKGQDAQLRVTLSFEDAALGTSTRVRNGSGKLIDAKIPQAVEDGQTIRLKGQGIASPNGGPNGDLLLKIAILPHSFYKRDGNNIRVEQEVSLDDAVLGEKINVDTIHGAIALRLPRNVSSGKTFRLKGKGIADSKGAGDQFVKILIVLPEEDDKDLLSLMKKWAKNKLSLKSEA